MKIYRSTLPHIAIPETSIASYLYPQEDPYPPLSPAYIDAVTEDTLTRGQMHTLSSELGWSMRNGLARLGGVKLYRGDTVLIFSPNCLAYPLALHGCFMAGLRVTVANASYTSYEIAHQFQDSAAKAIFVHPKLLDTILSMFKDIKIGIKEAKRRIIILQCGGGQKNVTGFIHMSKLLGKGQLIQEEIFDGNLCRETALICYSSGTTGKPKGVELMHRNLVAMCQVLSQVNYFKHGVDKTIGVIPFYHIYGAVLFNLFLYKRGVPVVISEQFDPVSFLAMIEKFGITFACTVPPILVVLARHPAVAQYNLRSLKILMTGAAPLSASLAAAVLDRLDSLGVKALIVQAYGMTEAAPATHFYGTEDCDRKIGAVGKLLSGIEARIVREDGHDAEEGEQGELWVRGAVVMKGYLNNPSATSDTMTKDGWLKTGDIASIDDEGFFKIVDRRKELIKYKGFQVPPAELEGVLLEHPDIADAGVVGIHSEEEATELPRAYIVQSCAAPTGEEKERFCKDVQEWVKARVAKHKYLRGGVAVVDAIPKSPSGKILRRELRERAKAETSINSKARL